MTDSQPRRGAEAGHRGLNTTTEPSPHGTNEGLTMKPLCEQLTDLAARAKKSEDFVAAGRST
jgi:hypothetical protein